MLDREVASRKDDVSIDSPLGVFLFFENAAVSCVGDARVFEEEADVSALVDCECESHFVFFAEDCTRLDRGDCGYFLLAATHAGMGLGSTGVMLQRASTSSS